MKWLYIFAVLLMLVVSVSAQQWCGIQDLYFQDVPSGLGSFHSLDNYASGLPITDENITIQASDGIVPIDSYISRTGDPGDVTLFGGLRIYSIYGYVSSVSQPSYFTINVSNYNIETGKETFFYNISSTAISSTTPQLDMTYYTSPNTIAFSGNDHVLIRIGAYTTRLSPTTIHFLNQGNTPTFVQSGYFECPILATAPGSKVDDGPAVPILCGMVGGFLAALFLIRRKQ